MFKPTRHLIGAAVLATITIVLVVLARCLPDFWYSFYTDFSRGAMQVLGVVFGWIPFPAWEILLVLLVIAILCGLVYAVRTSRGRGFLCALLELAVLLITLFVGLWGLNGFAPTIGEQTGLEVKDYTVEQLQEAASWYADEASFYSVAVKRDEDGNVLLPEFSELSDAGVAAYERLAEENDRFKLPVRQVKPLLVSEAFAHMGSDGVFMCLTGEAGVSSETFGLTQPFTICHELGHSLAVAREDEANYLGFLACRASDTPLFRYSGYYNAFVYCYEALYDKSPAAARKVREHCSDELLRDIDLHVEYDQQYEGKVRTIAQAVNNAYIKTFDEAGVRSYGLVVDYLVADYLKMAD